MTKKKKKIRRINTRDSILLDALKRASQKLRWTVFRCITGFKRVSDINNPTTREIVKKLLAKKKKRFTVRDKQIREAVQNPLTPQDVAVVYAIKRVPREKRWKVFYDMKLKDIKEFNNPTMRRILKILLPKKNDKND